MYSYPKLTSSVPSGESRQPGRSKSPSTVGQPQPMSGLYGWRSQSDRNVGQNAGYSYRSRYGPVGINGSGQSGSSEPKAPLVEPEHDEAFVEESGIKVFETTSSDQEDDPDEDECEDEELDEHLEEEDPLYQLDVMEDTIVEDDEDEEEDVEEEESDGEEQKRSLKNKDADGGQKLKPQISPRICDKEDCKKIISKMSEEAIDTSAITNRDSGLPCTCSGSSISTDGLSTNTQGTNVNEDNRLESTKPKWASHDSNSSTSGASTSSETETTPLDASSNESSSNSLVVTTSSSSQLLLGEPALRSYFMSTTTHSTSTIEPQVPCGHSIPSVQPSFTPSSDASAASTVQSASVVSSVPMPYQKKNGPNTPIPPIQTTSRVKSTIPSRALSPIRLPAPGLTGNMWAGFQPTETTLVGAFYNRHPMGVSSVNPAFTFQPGGRGRAIRMPLARFSAPKHKFIIRKVNEATSGDLLTGAGRNTQENARQKQNSGSGNIWVRRQMDSSTTSNTQTKLTTGEETAEESQSTLAQKDEKEPSKSEAASTNGTDLPAVPPPFRQRAGTWSMANSRRQKMKIEKEEEVATRQRRKSGDDLLNKAAAGGDKEKSKKDGGFLEAFRPRSKSDSKKRPNIISNVKNAVQQSLVSPTAVQRPGGRRSGEATPVEAQAKEDVYHTWHAGSGPKTTIGRVWELFMHRGERSEERHRRKSGGKHEKGQLLRRHSMEPDRRRHGSGSSSLYLRGEDPVQAAMTFRDSRNLPISASFLENVKRDELESDESKILVKFFKYHTSYDLIPTSAKLVIFDTRLQVKKAFYALVYNGVRAAPLWDSAQQRFVGMLTITDFIRILQSFYNSGNKKMDELEDHRLEMWRALLNDDSRDLISIGPNECLYEAIRTLIHHKIHRLPVIDPHTGNVLYIITHKRILKFLFLYINELPKPSILQKSLRELNIGSYNNIETAKTSTLIIEALNKFVQRRISALPIVDDDGKLVDIYAKFDVINLAAEGTYQNLDITLQQANEYRNEWFEGVLKCNLDETLLTIMERIVAAEVHRLVVVDSDYRVIGVISLSDILNELVLKPCDEDGLKKPKANVEECVQTSLTDSNDNLSRHKQGTGDSSDISTTEDISSSSQPLDEVFDSSANKQNEEKSSERVSAGEDGVGRTALDNTALTVEAKPEVAKIDRNNDNITLDEEFKLRGTNKISPEENRKSPETIDDNFVNEVSVPNNEVLQISG